MSLRYLRFIFALSMLLGCGLGTRAVAVQRESAPAPKHTKPEHANRPTVSGDCKALEQQPRELEQQVKTLLRQAKEKRDEAAALLQRAHQAEEARLALIHEGAGRHKGEANLQREAQEKERERVEFHRQSDEKEHEREELKRKADELEKQRDAWLKNEMSAAAGIERRRKRAGRQRVILYRCSRGHAPRVAIWQSL
jgi:predicted RNase H-like nuclease (RuvC/YqgF family)